jgi:hypothetical protein
MIQKYEKEFTRIRRMRMRWNLRKKNCPIQSHGILHTGRTKKLVEFYQLEHRVG